MLRSGAKVEIVPARASHVWTIARRMRQADRDEIAAISGRSPYAALKRSYEQSSVAYTALFDGRPEVMWGAGDLNLLTGLGCVWLLATDAVEGDQMAFLRKSVRLRDQLLQRYSVLRNVVDVRNMASIRWLRWLGATFSEPFEVRGNAFVMFEMRGSADV